MTPRKNFYRAIHKTLRFGHARILAALGSADFGNEQAVAALFAQLRGFLALGKGHLDGENREIHTALEARAPGATFHAAGDHDDHEESFVILENLMQAVEAAEVSERNAKGRDLYYRYALFMAHDLEHMNEEETELLALLHMYFTDEELEAIEHRIVSAIPPEKMMATMSLMIPALNHGERLEMLGKLRMALPKPAFDGVLAGTIKPALAANDYQALIGELQNRAA
jgi:hemerythrin-like domain-containing protein